MRYRAICRNNVFSRVYAKGKSYVHPQVVLYVLKTKKQPTMVGFTATKKIGNAVKRNRSRRIMKAALAEHLPPDTRGFHLVLVARGQTPFLNSVQLSKTIGKLFEKAGLPDLAKLQAEPPTQTAAPEGKHSTSLEKNVENKVAEPATLSLKKENVPVTE